MYEFDNNGALVQSGSSPALSITNAQVSDTGNYTVEIIFDGEQVGSATGFLLVVPEIVVADPDPPAPRPADPPPPPPVQQASSSAPPPPPSTPSCNPNSNAGCGAFASTDAKT